MPDTRDLVAKLERYCAEHPHACDSLDGISWWIESDRNESDRERLSEAVEQLVAAGRITQHRLADGSIVYSCVVRPVT